MSVDVFEAPAASQSWFVLKRKRWKHGAMTLRWAEEPSRRPRSTMIGTLPMTPMRMTPAELTGERRLLGPAV
jgi:hypothetical protein